MNEKAFIKMYAALDRDEELSVLARIAFQLTIAARETYVPQTVAIADPARLRMFNEMQHKITCRLAALTSKMPGSPSGAEFARWLFAGLSEARCTHVLSAVAPRTIRKKAVA